MEILDEPRGRCSVSDAYSYCQRLARARSENFPVATRFAPEAMRPHLLALYAFVRAANDFTDDPRYAARREEALATWEEDLHRAFHGEADHPIFVALMDTIERREIPAVPFQQLLTGFRMDLSTPRYATFTELRRYCDNASAPLGRLWLYLFGYRDGSLHCYADDMAVGLHLCNLLQDLGVDYNGARGRLYLPLEDLRHFGVQPEELRQARMTPAAIELMRFQVARAMSLLERGRPLLSRVGSDLSFELELIWQSGAALCRRIAAVGFDVLKERPTLRRRDQAQMLLRALQRRWR